MISRRVLGGGEDIGRDDLVEQAGELAIGEVDAVEGLELLAEVLLQRGAVADVGAVFVLEALELADEAVFDAVFSDDRGRGIVGLVVVVRGNGHGGQLNK